MSFGEYQWFYRPFKKGRLRLLKPGSAIAAMAIILMTPAISMLNASMADAGENLVCKLYFPHPSLPFLTVEERVIKQKAYLTDRIFSVISALASLKYDSRTNRFPDGLSLRRVFIDQVGTVYVDLSAETSKISSGVIRERLVVWSLVNTVCLNFSEAKRVKILVGGDEVDTLFGHIDLSRPLLPDESIIKK